MSLAAMVLAEGGGRLTRAYDRWIEVATLGRAAPARDAALAEIRPGQRVLDAGCGTGTLAVGAALAGAEVVGIDHSPAMLSVARRKATSAGVEVDWRQGDIAFVPLGEPPFDVVTATFVLGELSLDLAALAIRRLGEALRPGGHLVIVDEVPRDTRAGRLLVAIPRAIQSAVAFFALQRLAPTRRHPWRTLVEQAGLEIMPGRSRQSGGLVVLVARRPDDLPRTSLAVAPLDDAMPHGAWRVIRRAAAWIDLPVAVRPGVYRIGTPGRSGPVLLTGNFLASVEAVRAGLGGRDAYLVVEDSDGWNVWCAADAGLFSAERAVALMERHGVDALVDDHRIVVPRLGGRVRPRLEALSGWEVVIGPIEARDLPAFLASGLSPAMRSLDRLYGPAERLRVGLLTLLQLPVFLLPLRLLPSELRRPAWRVALVSGCMLPLAHGLLPGRTGVVKGTWLGVLAVILGVPSRRISPRAALVVLACSPLTGWIYQSSSPVVFWRRLLR